MMVSTVHVHNRILMCQLSHVKKLEKSNFKIGANFYTIHLQNGG